MAYATESKQKRYFAAPSLTYALQCFLRAVARCLALWTRSCPVALFPYSRAPRRPYSRAHPTTLYLQRLQPRLLRRTTPPPTTTQQKQLYKPRYERRRTKKKGLNPRRSSTPLKHISTTSETTSPGLETIPTTCWRTSATMGGRAAQTMMAMCARTDG